MVELGVKKGFMAFLSPFLTTLYKEKMHLRNWEATKIIRTNAINLYKTLLSGYPYHYLGSLAMQKNSFINFQNTGSLTFICFYIQSSLQLTMVNKYSNN